MKCGAKIILLAVLAIAAASFIFAEPVSQLKPTDYVNDFAHVLDQNTVTQLDELCKQIDEKAHAQIAVVTIKSLDGDDIDSYAVDLFHKWGVGSKSTDKGVLILLAVNDHKYRVEVGYGLEPILPDGKVGGFGREAVPQLKANDYSGAVTLITSRIADVIAQDAGIQLTGEQLQAPEQEQAGTFISRIVAKNNIHSGYYHFSLLFSSRFGRILLWGFCWQEVAADLAAASEVVGVLGEGAEGLGDLAAEVLAGAGRVEAGSEV